jgi:hypothetical protein
MFTFISSGEVGAVEEVTRLIDRDRANMAAQKGKVNEDLSS